jgi:hypothetical protein
MREHFVVPAIRSREIAGVEWPDVRRFEHFLQLFDVVDDAFNVGAFNVHGFTTSSKKRRGAVNLKRN